MAVDVWLPLVVLLMLYVVCLASIGARTFHRGHIWLGMIGAVVPVLWVLGAILPASSRSERRLVASNDEQPTVRLDRSYTGRSSGTGDRWADRDSVLPPSEANPSAGTYRGPNGERLVYHQQAVRVARPLIGRPIRHALGRRAP